jgi:hypothetical protein
MKVVYYPSLVPNNRFTVTQLAILFDEILLPGAYLPLGILDKAEIEERIAEIEAVDKSRNESSVEMLMPLYFAKEYGELAGIFSGTGKAGHMGLLEEGVSELTKRVEEAYFGPPEPGFTPVPTMGFNFGIGSGDVMINQINGPATFSYPANAFIYAQNNNMPIISDSTFMPIPSIKSQPPNADLLSTQLSIAALSLVLPKLRPLSADEILAVRSHMRKDIEALNATMAGYAGKLRGLAGQEADWEDIQREADFIAKTDVYPQLEYLRRTIETPGSVISRNMIDLTMDNPELITSLILQPHNLQLWMKALNATGKTFKNIIHDLRADSLKQNESGLSLLLKIPKKYK